MRRLAVDGREEPLDETVGEIDRYGLAGHRDAVVERADELVHRGIGARCPVAAGRGRARAAGVCVALVPGSEVLGAEPGGHILAAYRVVQEAVNVIKHTAADCCRASAAALGFRWWGRAGRGCAWGRGRGGGG